MQEAIIGPHPFAADGLLLIEGGVLSVMQKFRQDAPHKPEAGGILLGYRRGRHLHVALASTPSSADSRGRTHFYRKALAHQQFAMKRWLSSGGTLDYVGEWHTHPEMQPTPSRLDLEQWQAIHSPRNSAAMVFVIVGSQHQNWYGVGRGNILRRAILGPETT
ncbi:Mov34/MPN/PAD-1 family protein [Lysobacter brunescens]|uniref:Mov34/MPN/PAD-1 family protein n=1 Tax=Lysobacter brunescens TaxID=262323 RepID=A0ABW2Y765_9GAMM